MFSFYQHVLNLFNDTDPVTDIEEEVNTLLGSTKVHISDYPKDFIAPGASAEITVTYDGSNKMPGRFKKSILVSSNCKENTTHIYIQGDMTDVPVSKKTKKTN